MSQRTLRAHRRSVAFEAMVIGTLFWLCAPAAAQELVIGEERFPPGIVLIFEGAVRDRIAPFPQNLAENRTDVHVEARANWDAEESKIPDGAPPEGFVAYMNVHCEIVPGSSSM